MTDPIFGELEAHQVSLQAMHSNSLAGSFMDDVVKWQKRLQTIEAVLRTWLDVQELWIELEEVSSVLEISRKWPFKLTYFWDGHVNDSNFPQDL